MVLWKALLEPMISTIYMSKPMVDSSAHGIWPVPNSRRSTLHLESDQAGDAILDSGGLVVGDEQPHG